MAITTISANQIVFFQNQTTNATSPSFSFIMPKGTAVLTFWGTWGGGTITFNTMAPLGSGVFIPVGITPTSFTANGQTIIQNVVYGTLIQCVLTGATAPNLNVVAQAV